MVNIVFGNSRNLNLIFLAVNGGEDERIPYLGLGVLSKLFGDYRTVIAQSVCFVALA